MKKRNVFKTKRTLSNNNRRRILLKKVHQKTLQRRQQYQMSELFCDLAKAS